LFFSKDSDDDLFVRCTSLLGKPLHIHGDSVCVYVSGIYIRMDQLIFGEREMLMILFVRDRNNTDFCFRIYVGYIPV